MPWAFLHSEFVLTGWLAYDIIIFYLNDTTKIFKGAFSAQISLEPNLIVTKIETATIVIGGHVFHILIFKPISDSIN
jgi:hypothetical protein